MPFSEAQRRLVAAALCAPASVAKSASTEATISGRSSIVAVLSRIVTQQHYRLNGATSRHVGRSRLFRSCVSSPASRRRAVAVLERAAECRLRRVADVLRDKGDRQGGLP